MSSNLCQDNCPKCGYVFTLGDFRGKPIEFRQYGRYVPQMGCKLVCKCGCVLFGWVRSGHTFWGNADDAFKDELRVRDVRYPNQNKGKFAIKIKDHQDREYAVETGFYQIDLAYYESGRDEGEGVDDPNPANLFTRDDDQLTRWDHHREQEPQP